MVNERPIIQVSITVPARDEQETIGAVLSALQDLTDDPIVISRHSSDRTASISRHSGATVIRDDGKGKGEADRTCSTRRKVKLSIRGAC
jgi:glycosyltransferase involved in cell wall biosynthesis